MDTCPSKHLTYYKSFKKPLPVIVGKKDDK